MEPTGAGAHDVTARAAASTSVQVLVPRVQRTTVEAVLTGLAAANVTAPFAAERMEFVAHLSRALSKRGRGLPETQALAFWMRKAELQRMARDVSDATPHGVILMPRGTVFHVPPANVDTLFVYSLVLSVLAGNRNVVRLSSRATDQSNLILDTINEVLLEHPLVADGVVMLTYGHDQDITEAISAKCDTRVIWGGDATIETIRKAPLGAHATEVTFPDRFSMAAIATAAYAELDESGRDALAEKFFNDAYWFDQLGCSSARLLVWVGEAPEALTADFHARVHAMTVRKGYEVDASAAIAKLSQATRAMIDDEVTTYVRYDNELTVVDVAAFPHARGEFCGAGLFYEMHVQALADLAPHITRTDQTLAVFGIPHDELRALVHTLAGRGIDRIVPFGQALAFDRIWDGYDIFGELVRRISVSA